MSGRRRHAAQAVAHDRVVVDDRRAGCGSGAGADQRPRLPGPVAAERPCRPRPDSTARSPASRAPAGASPRSPKPLGAAGHRGRSRRRRRARRGPPRRPCTTGSRPTRVASACFATLVSASWAMRSTRASISGAGPGRRSTSTRPAPRVPDQPATRRRAPRAACAVQRAGREVQHRPPRLGEALARQSRPRRARSPLAGRGRLQLRDDARQALRDRVVDLAGQPLAFVLHTGLARLHHQLRVQPAFSAVRLRKLDVEPLKLRRRAARSGRLAPA